MYSKVMIAAMLVSASAAGLAQTAPAPGAQAGSQQLSRVEVVGTPLPSVKEFFDNPQYGTLALSADAEYMMVTTPINGRLNLAVIELKTRKGVALTNFSDFDVLSPTWVGSSRIVFSLGNLNSPTGPDRQDGGGFFMVGRDGKESRKLSPTIKELRSTGGTVYRGINYLRAVPKSEDEIIGTVRERSADSLDVYRINVRTGAKTLLSVDRPSKVSSFLLDKNLQVRVAVSEPDGANDKVIWHRADDKSPWVQLARFDETKGPAFYPVAFLDDDQKTLAVATNEGRATMAIYRYDPAAKKLGELLAEHPRYDLGRDQQGASVPGLVLHEDRLVGVRVEADKPQVTWIDPDFARLQKMIDGALPNTANNFTRVQGSRLIVTSFSDRQPNKWYLLDEKAKSLEELLVSMPWIKPEALVEQRPMIVKTRDGLELPGYVFVPKNRKAGERLPTIINIHGGPQVRADQWGFRRGWGTIEGQFFASRGYVVILPNHRITPGLGSKNYYSGFGAFGSRMIEDHEDAVKWAVDQGFTDPNRVCIYGASYGGYATLMSLAKTPDMYKCGVAALPVSDVAMQLTSASTDFAANDEAVLFWRKLIGAENNPKPFSEVARAVSPAFMADRIKAPVFLIAGEADRRTPLEQTRAMQRALERAGNPPKMMIKIGEGHGFGRVENRVDQYTQMLEFFDKHIGDGSRPM